MTRTHLRVAAPRCGVIKRILVVRACVRVCDFFFSVDLLFEFNMKEEPELIL